MIYKTKKVFPLHPHASHDNLDEKLKQHDQQQKLVNLIIKKNNQLNQRDIQIA